MKRTTLVVVVLLVVIQWNITPSAAQPGSSSRVIQLVNEFRAANGLGPLALDGALTAAAEVQANFMISTRQFGHTGEGGSTPQDRAVAAGYQGIAYENYVHGTGLSAEGALNWWKNSGIHRATMLLPQGQHIGVAAVADGGSTLYVLVVGYQAQLASPGGDSGGEDDAEPAGPIVVPVMISQPRDDGSVWHVVEQGQTAWDIAVSYRVDLNEMLLLNNMTLPATLHPGDEILVKLGPGQAPPPTPTLPAAHTVQEGEAVWDIAMRYGLTVDDLLAYNGLTRADVIQPGDTLLLRPGAVVDVLESPIVLPLPDFDAAPETASDGEAVAAAPTDALPPTNPPPPTLTLTPTVMPSPTLALPTVTPVPTGTASPTPQKVAAADTPTPEPPADSQDGGSSTRSRVTLIGIGALVVVWVTVIGIGAANWVLGRRRG
jgi:LysM repeat protein